MSNPSPAAIPEQAATTTNACQRAPLMLRVSTATGSGTFREGDHLSPPITLSTRPQTVTFPRPRPESGSIQEGITIEGNATNLITTSPITNYRTVFENINGVAAFTATWLAKPVRRKRLRDPIALARRTRTSCLTVLRRQTWTDRGS